MEQMKMQNEINAFDVMEKAFSRKQMASYQNYKNVYEKPGPA